MGSCFEKSAFWTKSLGFKVNGENIQYLYYTKPSLAFKKPVVILNDGFYNMDAMEGVLSALKDSFPVYFVTLPGISGNQQNSTEMLSSTDYSNLIKSFCDKVGVESINLLGISYSAILAYNFAATYPECVNRLILQGITADLRNSIKLIIQENLKYLKENKIKKFAASFSMNIMNFSRKEMINKGNETHQQIYNKYLNINEEQRKDIELHFKRMLNQNELSGTPTCPTLTLAGQYDHFTTPYENFLVSKKCTNSTFGILKRVDHFASLEKNKMMNKIYDAFFKKNSIDDFSGLDLYTDDFYPSSRRQIEPRYRWEKSVVARTDFGLIELEVEIIDLNGQGCKIHIPSQVDLDIDQIKTINIDIFPDCSMDLLLFKKNKNHTYHGVFQHHNIEQTYQFINVLADQVDGKKSFKAAA